VNESTPITESEVQALAANWYAKLDAHAPVEDFMPLLAQQGLEMHYPEGVFKGIEGFQEWYNRVIRLFFDEHHELKEVAVLLPADPANATVVVNWQGSFWKPPEPRSQRIVLDSYHTWVVKRSPDTNKPAILKYVVEKLEYAKGSARL